MGLAPRVACAEHGVAAAQVPWAEPDSRLTSGFEMECAWPAAVASQKTAGGFPRIAWRTAGHIARRVAARLEESSMPCMFDGPTAIGVDETSHRKGHTYITVAVDHKRKRVAWAHDGYGKEVLDLFFRQLTDEQRASIRIVTGDGAKWIDASVKERPPNAERVPDSFHIVSRMSDAPDQVRKRLRNQTRRGNDKTATETMKGLKYAVPKNPGDLTERQSGALETPRDTDPRDQPYRSWQLKELPRTLPHQPVGQAGAGLERWIFRASHSRIPEIVELCRKSRRRKDDILKTIRLGHSNARLEAFNNKIKVTIRMAYGFRHVDDLIAMIKLRCSGPPIHLPTSILQPTKTAESSKISARRRSAWSPRSAPWRRSAGSHTPTWHPRRACWCIRATSECRWRCPRCSTVRRGSLRPGCSM